MAKIRLTDEAIQKAAAGFDSARMKALPAPEDCDHEFSDSFYESLLRYMKKRNGRKRFFRRAAAAMLALLLCGGLILTGSTEARATFFTWVRDSIHSLAYRDLRPTDSLVIYIPSEWEYYERQERHRADLFRLLYGVNVELVVVEGGLDAYQERVLADTARGEGPDILNLSYFDMDLAKAVMNGELLDLTDILAEDEDFREEDYLDGVFETGRFGGGQYAVPISIYPTYYLTVPSALDELGYRRNRIRTLSDHLEELARLTPEAEKNPEFVRMTDNVNQFSFYLMLSGVRLLDYETGTVLPDEKTFGEFIRGYKAYFPYDYAEPGDTIWYGYGADALRKRQYYFCDYAESSNLVYDIDNMNRISLDYELVTLPGQTGETVGYDLDLLAISADARNKLNAYLYIKMMLSENIQTDLQILYADPIHKAAIRARLNFYIYGSYCPEDNPNKTLITEKEQKELYEVMTGIDRYVTSIPYRLRTLVFQTMLPYFRDEKSYQACLTELKAGLTNYLEE